MKAKPTKAERRVRFYDDDSLAQSTCAVAYSLAQCHEEHHRRMRVLPRFSEALKRQNYRYTNGQWKAQVIAAVKPLARSIVACRVFDKDTDRLLFSFSSTPSFLRVWKEDNAPFYGVFTPRKDGPKSSPPKEMKASTSLQALVESHEAHMDLILGKSYTESQKRPGYPWQAIEGLREEAEELGREDLAKVFDTMLQDGCTLGQASNDWRLVKEAKAFYSERMAG